MLILLDALPPAERIAFVLHDMFDVPFGTTSRRSSGGRPRRRVSLQAALAGAYAAHRPAAMPRRSGTMSRARVLRSFTVGNFAALLALLDPAATLRADAAVLAMGGAAYWQSDNLQRGIESADAVARTFSKRASAAQPVFIDGEPAAVWMQAGRSALRSVLR